MEETLMLLSNILKEGLLLAVLSDARKKDDVIRVRITPYKTEDGLYYQAESFTEKQAFHKNMKEDEVQDEILSYGRRMKQLHIETRAHIYTLMFNKKGRLAKRKTENNPDGEREIKTGHNREKQYILKEGMDIPFLKDLGVMTQDNKVTHAGFDKFKQINRFLEFIADVVPDLRPEGPVRIVDFGCGKSYLTFAVYYYFTEILKRDVSITGLDLKEDVIQACQALSETYGCQGLKFQVGDIRGYKEGEGCDLVITLHACDTATDYALAQAIAWKSRVILSVPCCQHELNRVIQNETLKPVLSYGILKDRFSAILTDTLRAEYLKNAGYDVQVLEFIDMAHTPKNILIRATRTGKCAENREDIQAMETAFNARLTLGKLLNE